MNILDQQLLHTLRVKHWMLSADLLKALAISRPTLSRALQRLGPQVISRGKARRTSYAARRTLRGQAESIPLFRVDAQGQCQRIAQLDLTWPQGCALAFEQPCEWPLPSATPSMQDGWFEGLPFFLDDMRPQGFWGRHFARQWASLLQVSDNPKDWSEDDVLVAISLLGADLPGCYIVGEPAAQRFLEQKGHAPTPLHDEARLAAYPQMALDALQHGMAGTSAGGEFPKFPATRLINGETVHVLVKFSGADDSPSSRRWSDLLVCEHLALEVLRAELGIASANSQLVQAEGRTFLEVQRFDRIGAHGRLPVCSWQALNAAWFGMGGKPWPQAAERLLAQGLIDAHTAHTMATIGWYGQYIANTDMHDGNLAFTPNAPGPQSSLCLAPVYDMLPMHYAPQPGMELLDRPFNPTQPPSAPNADWEQARKAAQVFWQAVERHPWVSDGFKGVAVRNAGALRF